MFLCSKKSIRNIFHYSIEKYSLKSIKKAYLISLIKKYLKYKDDLFSEESKLISLDDYYGITYLYNLRIKIRNRKAKKSRQELKNVRKYYPYIKNIEVDKKSVNGKCFLDLEKGEKISENIPFSNQDVVILSISVLVVFIVLSSFVPFFQIVVFDDILKHATLMFFLCIVLASFISILLRLLSLSNVHIEFIDSIASSYNKAFGKNDKHYQYILGVCRGGIKFSLYIILLFVSILSPSILPYQDNFGVCFSAQNSDFKYELKEPIYRTTNLTILKEIHHEENGKDKSGADPTKYSGANVTKPKSHSASLELLIWLREISELIINKFNSLINIIINKFNSLINIDSYSLISNNRVVYFGDDNGCNPSVADERGEYINIVDELSLCENDEDKVLFKSHLFFGRGEPLIDKDYDPKYNSKLKSEDYKPWMASLVRGKNDNGKGKPELKKVLVNIYNGSEIERDEINLVDEDADEISINRVYENDHPYKIYFDKFSKLKGKLFQKINENVNAYSNLKLFIVSYTDHMGSSLKNLSLSDRRIHFTEYAFGINCFLHDTPDCKERGELLNKLDYYPIPFSEISYISLRNTGEIYDEPFNKLRVAKVLLCK